MTTADKPITHATHKDAKAAPELDLPPDYPDAYPKGMSVEDAWLYASLKAGEPGTPLSNVQAKSALYRDEDEKEEEAQVKKEMLREVLGEEVHEDVLAAEKKEKEARHKRIEERKAKAAKAKK